MIGAAFRLWLFLLVVALLGWIDDHWGDHG